MFTCTAFKRSKTLIYREVGNNTKQVIFLSRWINQQYKDISSSKRQWEIIITSTKVLTMHHLISISWEILWNCVKSLKWNNGTWKMVAVHNIVLCATTHGIIFFACVFCFKFWNGSCNNLQLGFYSGKKLDINLYLQKLFSWKFLPFLKMVAQKRSLEGGKNEMLIRNRFMRDKTSIKNP